MSSLACWVSVLGGAAEVGEGLPAGLRSEFPTSAKQCVLGFGRSPSGLGQGLLWPRGSCGLRWAEEDPPTREPGPALRLLARSHRGTGTQRAGTRSEGQRQLLAVPRSTLRQSSSFFFSFSCVNEWIAEYSLKNSWFWFEEHFRKY